YAEAGAQVVVGGEEAVALSQVNRQSALGKYLIHLIGRNRYLQLQGIRSGGRLVHIELEHIYITLRSTQQRPLAAEGVANEEAWLAEEAQRAPGEWRRARQLAGGERTMTQTVTVSVNEALRDHRRLVVLGDPGSGKTTLLRYLALIYAQGLADNNALVADKLGLSDAAHLPILLPLRQIGAFLRDKPEETDGHRLLLEFFRQSLASERIDVPLNFFDQHLQSGRAAVLLDGMDEVADPNLRRRVSRLVEAFVRAYGDCRYVITSRIVGYSGAAQLGEKFKTTTVRDFTLSDIRHFLTYWHSLIAAGQMGAGASADAFAKNQTGQLLTAIENNDRIRELAINPLMLTVIALVHRDRVKLPDRRAELYAEAVDVLLGKWDEARGVKEERPILADRPFDTGDKRLMLQSVALYMHEKQIKEIEADELQSVLATLFADIVNDQRAAERATTRFLRVIQERTGLLVARGEGVYAFSHLTFQEYLAALAVLAEEEYVAYVLARTANSWWKEAVLLVAGQLSMTSKQRTTSLIRAIADLADEPEPYHNLVLAAECLRDAGSTRVLGDLENDIQRRLRADIALNIGAEIEQRQPKSGWDKFWRGLQGDQFDEKEFKQELVQRKIAAATALGRLGDYTSQGYWKMPYGEPDWVDVPAGEFVMGSSDGREDEKPQHTLYLDNYQIARVPVTNAQYRLFVEAAKHDPPPHWEEGKIPKGLESHPVVRVTWHDTIAYCR
ncbi:MAG: SUMF1/EgtB/PvdO family nonheme iron enzyme, partial [Chloroflexi bacterium]|nr:SUMF1/EgtB/PvdO family nonheme iron enzyme [Chloroflexota bacterium]